MDRGKRLKLNTFSGLLLQVTTIICGFILPRAILSIFGSDVNGLVNSIAQFLQIIAFLELGVGAVVQSSMYKPFAENDYDKISEIVAASNGFFRKIAIVLFLYVVALIFVFPLTVGSIFENSFSIVLIVAMSVSYFAQYFFGMTDRLFLNAVQKNYITNFINIVTLVINTAGCYLLIYGGCSIQIIKIVTSLVFLVRPIVIRIYIDKNYKINRNASYTSNTIEQKWNGIAQHISAIILDSTDILVLSIFSSFANVSIYSVYNIVVSGIRQLFLSAFNGVQSLFGELWAKKEKKKLDNYFSRVDWILHFSVVIIWSCTYKLIVPFVSLYVKEVNDVNYSVPIFAFMICIAFGINCLKQPFHVMILAAGHYKQTQHVFVISAFLNLIISIACVRYWGLIGVALGTIAGMSYQTLCMQKYCITKLNIFNYKMIIKQYLTDIFVVLGIMCVTRCITYNCYSWGSWIYKSVITFVITIICATIINSIFYRDFVLDLIKRCTKGIKKW